jgi:hypothetical protein
LTAPLLAEDPEEAILAIGRLGDFDDFEGLTEEGENAFIDFEKEREGRTAT